MTAVVPFVPVCAETACARLRFVDFRFRNGEHVVLLPVEGSKLRTTAMAPESTAPSPSAGTNFACGAAAAADRPTEIAGA
jgi:hypothetical protein